MAQDIGTSNMPDVDATTPADPTTGRAQSDYQVPQPLFQSDFGLPKSDQNRGIEVLIRSTPFIDAVTGFRQFLSNFLTIEQEENGGAVMALSIFAYAAGLVGDVTKVARVDWQFNEHLTRFFPKGLVQMRLKSIQNDTFTCHTFDSEEEDLEEDIIVAQPPKFQKTIHSGKTVSGVAYSYPDDDPHTREATATIEGEEQTITEQIIPKYEVDQLIYVMPVIGSPGLPESADYIAMNIDGRQWGKTGVPD